MINTVRLNQMVNLISATRSNPISAELPIAKLQPFMSHQNVEAGEVLFRRGDFADRLYVVLSGQFHLLEIGKYMGPGSVVGEIALIKPNRERSQSLLCVESGRISSIRYEKIEEICQQSPLFSLHFFRLVSTRLINDIEQKTN